MAQGTHQPAAWATYFAILALAALAIVVVTGLYVFRFGTTLSDSQEIWGQFGGYFGGTLNPVLSFGSLIAILITVGLQSRQLQLSATELALTRQELKRTADAAADQAAFYRRAERRTDIYRLIETLATRINKHFNENRLDENRSLHWFVTDNTDPDAKVAIDGILNAYGNESTKTHKAIKWVELDLQRLAHYTAQYEESSDTRQLNTPLREFYRVEFGGMVNLLHHYSIIAADVHDFYCK